MNVKDLSQIDQPQGIAGLARRVPVQKRSRERYELILKTAMEILTEKGSDGFKMSDIVERTKISFGSLYQYFPDKTAVIGTLLDRYNQLGHDCVQAELATIITVGDLHPSLCRLVDSYYQVFMDVPVMADLLDATQSDKILQKLDEEDMNVLSGFLLHALERLPKSIDKDTLELAAVLMMKLIAAAVRHAINLETEDAEKMLTIFKNMLPLDVKTLLGHP